MSDPNFSAIRARLRYESIQEFVEGYGRYISKGGMFVPMAPQKLKPVGTTVRFQFLLADGSSAMLGEGIVRQIKGVDDSTGKSPVGMLVKFTKLSPDTKELVRRIVEHKSGAVQIPQEAPKQIAVDERQSQPTPLHGAEAVSMAAAAGQEGDTGVLEGSAADQLRQQVAPSPQNEDLTAEVELPLDDEDYEEPPTSGDEIFGGATSGEHSLGDDPSYAVAEALASGSSEVTADEEPEPQQSPEPELGAAVGGGSFFDDDDDFLGEVLSEAGMAVEAQALSEAGADVGLAVAPAPEPAFEPEPEPEPSPEPVFEPVSEPEPEPEPESAEPRALKETEGGIKVMSFDGDDDLDELATREFEEFASGSEDEDFDAMFDNVFGGGGDGGDGLFGGGGGGDDFFGGGGEEVAEVEPEAESDPAFELEDIVEDPAEPEPQHQPQAAPVEESEPSFVVDSELIDEEDDDPFEAAPPPEPISEKDGDSSERIRSLLSMDSEVDSDGEEEEMVLNLGGSVGAQKEEPEEDDPDDSMESLLANAQKEIEKKAEQKEEEERDILDELLGDDELPPPGGPPALNVPQPMGKKKKKGFISKIFGDND